METSGGNDFPLLFIFATLNQIDFACQQAKSSQITIFVHFSYQKTFFLKNFLPKASYHFNTTCNIFQSFKSTLEFQNLKIV